MDREIGRNLARLRGRKSQAELAEEMRARGWRWSQATVSSVELGERPLRLAEARDLAAIQGVRVDSLVGADPMHELVIQERATVKAAVQLERAAEGFAAAKWQLAEIANSIDGESGALSFEDAPDTHRLLETTVGTMAASGFAHFLEDHETDRQMNSRWGRLFIQAERPAD